MSVRSAIATSAAAVLLAVPIGCGDDKPSLFEQRAVEVFTDLMRADLTRWASGEQSYRTANGQYTLDGTALMAMLPQWPSSGVTITVTYLTGTSVGAIAEHTLTSRRCAAYVGTPPNAPILAGVALTSGQPGCEP